MLFRSAGKTVLLTDWVRRGGARVAWLNPTAADADPSRFWRLLLSALRECGGAPVAMPRGVGIDLAQTLFSAVPESAAQLVVIIDDAHVLTHAEVLQGLDSLIRAGQPGLRLVLAARSDPLLPLHRYRLAGQMRELRAADLAMSSAEIREVLAVHGVSLGERDFGILAARPRDGRLGYGCPPCGWRVRSIPETSSRNSRLIRAASVSTWWTRCFASSRKHSAVC